MCGVSPTGWFLYLSTITVPPLAGIKRRGPPRTEMAAKRETAGRFFLFLKSIPVRYYYRILFGRGRAGSCLNGTQIAPFAAISERGFKGGGLQ